MVFASLHLFEMGEDNAFRVRQCEPLMPCTLRVQYPCWMNPERRQLLKAAVATMLSIGSARRSLAITDNSQGPLTNWIKHPFLLTTLYRHGVTNKYDASGAAGANVGGYRWIEEQRQGAEWIVRGFATGKADWQALGWRELDWGLAHQQSNGGFES